MAVNIYNDFTTPLIGQANIGIMPVEITSTGSIKDGLSYKVVVAYRYEDQSDIVDFMPAFIENMATVQTALNLDGYISVTDITQTDVYVTQAVENGQLINYYIFKYDLQIAADSGDFEASENELQIYDEQTNEQVIPLTTGNVSAIIDMVYPVGTYYYTASQDFDPNTAWANTIWTLDTNKPNYTWLRTA